VSYLGEGALDGTVEVERDPKRAGNQPSETKADIYNKQKFTINVRVTIAIALYTNRRAGTRRI
jgi:hypothetical protein